MNGRSDRVRFRVFEFIHNPIHADKRSFEEQVVTVTSTEALEDLVTKVIGWRFFGLVNLYP